MKFTLSQSFDLHVCFQEYGGDEVIQYEVHHRWHLLDCRRDVLDGDELQIKMESQFAKSDNLDNLDSLGFRLRYGATNNKVAFRQGRRRNRFPFIGTKSGGNMYWDVIVFPAKFQPHVFNCLRNLKHGKRELFSPSEWIVKFYEEIWQSRRPLAR